MTDNAQIRVYDMAKDPAYPPFSQKLYSKFTIACSVRTQDSEETIFQMHVSERFTRCL